MRRLFIGIPVPERTKAEILKEADIKASLTDQGLWNITLCLLGMQEDEDLILITQAIDKAITQMEYLDIFFSSYYSDEDNSYLRVNEKSNRALEKVRKLLVNSLLDAGVSFRVNQKIIQAELVFKGRGGLKEKDSRIRFAGESINLYESYKKGGVRVDEVLYTGEIIVS